MSVALERCGIYPLPMAQRLLGGVTYQKLRGWLVGHSGSGAPPLVHGQLERIDRQLVLTFTNLMEARFIWAFAKEGIPIQSIRVWIEEAQRVLNHPHPFATAMIRTDGKDLFIDAVERFTGDQKLYSLRKHNWGFYDVLADGLREGVEWDQFGNAKRWTPLKNAPNVVLSPETAFGQPALRDSGVPTSAIASAVEAEGGDVELVARLYRIRPVDVRQALRFEDRLSEGSL